MRAVIQLLAMHNEVLVSGQGAAARAGETEESVKRDQAATKIQVRGLVLRPPRDPVCNRDNTAMYLA